MLENLVDILVKNKLRPNEFILGYLLIHREKYKRGEYGMNPTYYKYVAALQDRGGFTVDDVEHMIHRGFLYKSYPDNEGLDQYEVTDKFEKIFWKETVVAGEELWEEYPSFMNIKGRKQSLKACDKEEVILKYMRIIDFNPDKHDFVMDQLKKGIELDMCNMSIAKWVGSEQWNEIRRVDQESTYLKEG